MNDELRIAFLTYYIRSLGERTRDERAGTKFGFDWIIYNLGLVDGWLPYRLPFLRGGPNETSKTKTEPEFGIDLAFLSRDRTTLRIFVLKDEVLNNKNWTNHDFDTDLRNASAPDLCAEGLDKVTTVEVILAYNKDEDNAGITLYNRRVKALGNAVGDRAALRFDRWNLSTIVERVLESLLSPALLPQKFFSQFVYICSQFADFRHGSDAWVQQLIPNWQNFLEGLLSDDPDERCVRLLPVALIVLQENGRKNDTAETGWIDLIEWGMLAAWNIYQNTKRQDVRAAVQNVWVSFYLTELERYYEAHGRDLAVPFSLDRPASGSFVDAISTAIKAHWHLGRIGVLALGYAEVLPQQNDQQRESRFLRLNATANLLLGFLNANPSALRPILDIHHVELILTWGVLRQANRVRDLQGWLLTLSNRLAMRRSGIGQIPFLEGHNSLELVFEYVATNERPPEFCDGSSVFLTVLLELICSLAESNRDPLLEQVFRRLVLGQADCGTQIEGREPVDLMLWFPPADWEQRILARPIASDGECTTVTLGKLQNPDFSNGAEIAAAVERFVAESRRKRSFDDPKKLPLSVIALGCIKQQTPMPPELWRESIFGAAEALDSDSPHSLSKSKKKKHELSTICCQRNPEPDVQRREILALVKSGADVQETDKSGVTPLHHAVRFRSPAAVAALIECGANVNAMCKRSGSSALHRAVTTGAAGTAGRRAQALEILKLLLAAGADPSLSNKLGKRPIDYVKDDEMRGLLSAS